MCCQEIEESIGSEFSSKFRTGNRENEVILFEKELNERNIRPHPNVIKMFGTCKRNDQMMIIFELTEGSLWDLIKVGQEFDQQRPDYFQRTVRHRGSGRLL